MPIRPELRHLYRGPAWRAIRDRILARAGHKCERCGVPNRTTVLRQYGWWTEATLPATVWAYRGRFNDITERREQDGAIIENLHGDHGFQFIVLPWKVADRNGRPVEYQHCFPITGEHRWVHIILTIAHLDHNPHHNDDLNLQALCQWCHLKHDVRFHHANARRTRAARSGQAWLTPELEQGVTPCNPSPSPSAFCS